MPWPSSAVNSGPRRLSQAHGITETCRNSQPTCSAASCSSPADRPDVQSQAQSPDRKGLSGRGERDSEGLSKPSQEPRCGPQPLGGSIADGRALILEPQPANVQDRDGAPLVLRLSRRSFPFIVKAFADRGFAGDGPAKATSITVEIVRKPPDQVGFAVHPRRWGVERFFAWISRNRRLWKDPEATLTSARAFLYAASIMLLVRRLGRLS